MTSEIDVSKTNELQRRRKLRLQQVREQSKDIAKKIRQRAKVEKLRNVINVDAKKEEQYFELQDKLVGRLEHLYSQSLQNVGVGHKNALSIKESDKDLKKDLSKSRGKEAVAELRKRKQEKLDEQKKILDRKLQAREAANELSREKSTIVAKALSTKSVENLQANNIDICNNNIEKDCQTDKAEVTTNSDIPKNDMGTQWEEDGWPNEWSLPVPTLLLPKDDKDSYKDSGNDGDKSDKNKRINLFALSDEMPPSLRGGLSSVQTDIPSVKPSMSLISEYLLSRSLRLRENDPVVSTKKSDDLQSIKQTIVRSRASRPDVSGKSDQSKSTRDTLNRINSVTMYNHSTRDTRDIACHNDAFVTREHNTTDDAYTKALKETSIINDMQNKELERKKEDMRNKVAMTKEKVDKEYRDTLAFLNSLSKDTTSRVQKIAHMDEDRQQMQQEKHQRRMQDEFRKIERECAKHSCKHSKKQSTILNRSKSRSPDKLNYTDNILPRNFQYDWMPVPESDGNLAVHTIASTKNPKSSNTVKFNDVDTYHEYRSRHKHTPPTKDVSKDRERKRFVETVILEQSSNETTDASSVTSDASHYEQNINDDNKTEKDILDDPRLSDADRIVIYKILNSKKIKKSKGDKKSKAINRIFKSLSSMDNGDVSTTRKGQSTEKLQCIEKEKESDSHQHEQTPFENLSEGIYKVSENGNNIASMYFTDKNQPACLCKEQERTTNGTTKCTKNPNGSEQINTENDRNTSRNQHQCSGCKCSCSNTQNAQASTATSTSSFQTASNDKGANVFSDGGLIKLIEDGGQDTGKFYIGASGFLKDDKYEVVIQLKKKDTQQIESKSQEVNVNIADEPSSSKSLPKVDMEVHSSLRNNVRECAAQTSLTKDCTVVDESLSRSRSEPGLIKSAPMPDLHLADNKLITEQENEPESRVDKDNITQDSFAIPANLTKTEPVSRPATSTYTQTSFSSPNSRPVFLHMTSSTSTAYMSPPEFIMPHHLKKIRTLSYKDVAQDKKYEKYNQDCIKVNKKCKWKHKRSTSVEKLRKCRHLCSTDTPPNTAHSYDYGSWSENIESEKLRQKSHSRTCRSVHKHKNHFTMHKSSPKCSVPGPLLSNKNIHKLYHTRPSTSNKNCFNPVVKQYVNKLLSLNKESVKAIQVVNQDCSAVDTPGSSIINNPFNIGDQFSHVQNKISLQQIKMLLEQQIMRAQADENQPEMTNRIQRKYVLKLPRKKQVHKVKSLNISKRILRNKTQDTKQHPSTQTTAQPESTSSSMKEPSLPNQCNQDETDFIRKPQHRRQSSSTSSTSDHNVDYKGDSRVSKHAVKASEVPGQPLLHYSSDGTYRSNELYKLPVRRTTLTSVSTESLRRGNGIKNNSQIIPTDISTQTSGIDSEINFMKLAENKLQNMEKIADLTEKCTKRLSNLAKVLEEVRKNKSMVYSHISTSESTTSDSEPKNTNVNEKQSLSSDVTLDMPLNPSSLSPDKTSDDKDHNFVPLLKDIPKPLSPSTLSLSTISEKSNIPTTISSTDQIRNRRPPPALSRLNLKKGQDLQAVPHELSTVMEVDSPMSIKNKNQSSCRELSQEVTSTNKDEPRNKLNEKAESQPVYEIDSDVKNSKVNSVNQHSSDSVDSQKVQIMDMRLFNDIMLKPFLSLQEYAKQCDLRIDEGSNIDDVLRDEPIQEELSSLHSDGSLPDVISELLKRKIIDEPFKFDTASHINTTSLSSESSFSMLALSKIRKERKRPKNLFINKENIGETSETLSISSNPDLENAFQKLGMGWASSTLKKTKERLALSSSSNTSSSSVSQLKFKNYNKDVATITTTESTISEHNNSYKKSQQSKNVVDISKNAEQQTSLINSMTVKEFLTNELAKKITFTNKSSRRNDEEFVSLYETKMPEEIKNTSEMGEQERTITSLSNNRARTSTPVQIFKSATYQSTSSTNTSNGLFSNADELSSVKVTSTSIRNHSTSDKDDLTIPNYSLKRKGLSDCSKSE